MSGTSFDDQQRFVLESFASRMPFSSFLPGIAGPLGTPLWVFYVNRGQAVTSFGVGNKDNPIMEFFPANKAYQSTPYTGFRTFLKFSGPEGVSLYEPFSPWRSDESTQMFVGLNELELQTTNPSRRIQTNVLYFVVPGEDFAALVRQVRVTNVGDRPIAFELLDGMPRVIPFGADNWGLKNINRTLEAWMEVFHLDRGIPFYRLRASAGDTTEVVEFQAGHFYLALTADSGPARRLPAIVDPRLVFGEDTSLSVPHNFARTALEDLVSEPQVTVGRTPSGLFGLAATLEPGEATTLHALIGHTSSDERLYAMADRIGRASYIQEKRQEARQLVRKLTDVVDTRTDLPVFDAYCRQTFLDNVMRGGWPIVMGEAERPVVYHVYSRKHGDPERDYNDFYLAPEPYSQGNGNYRDVNQNRRCDVLLNPKVGDFNALIFLGLIQLDGYNPLVVQGSRLTVPPEARAGLLEFVEQPELVSPILERPFSLGELVQSIRNTPVGLTVDLETFIAKVSSKATQHVEASFGEGYWVDHWFYNLDLIDTYLAVYPDRETELLMGESRVPYYDSAAAVLPRWRRYVRTHDGRVRQYGAVHEADGEKLALIDSRTEQPRLMRTAHGRGEVYRTTVLAKLVGLAVVKFSTLDPGGMGIEMEAGKPGWYDALNGLPGLFGSSMCETYELHRLLTFLIDATNARLDADLMLPIEQVRLLEQVRQALSDWADSSDPDRDFVCWDRMSTAREAYREDTRLGIDGATHTFACRELGAILTEFRSKVALAIERSLELGDGVPPTYLEYRAIETVEILDGNGQPERDDQGRPYAWVKQFEVTPLPPFLEGPVHALKLQADTASARSLHRQVKESELFDRELGMYKVNASLASESHEIGRAKAFPPGWLENESIWLHMEYKYLLELLRAGLYEEFYEALKTALVPFQPPARYGRSPLENSSFIASSAHPDPSLHGAGFVARLSGSTAEFLSLWTSMMAGERPFLVSGGELQLKLSPALPGWFFTDPGIVSFRFLGHCDVTYHNPRRLDTYADGIEPRRIVLWPSDSESVGVEGHTIGAPYAEMVRSGDIGRVEVFF